MRIPKIGQGTWHLEKAERRLAIAALRRGIDLGMTHIDTAEMYGSGAAEEIAGEAIEGRRDGVFLVSKVLPGNASQTGTVQACERSLKRLKTDYLDAYLLHWRGGYPLEATFAGFEQLRREGKIRAWGVSNFDVEDLEEAWRIAGSAGFWSNQVLYNLQERAIEHAVLPWCEAHRVTVVAYSPFGSGHFPAPESHGGRMLERIAESHGATVRQIALSFVVRRQGVLTIPKAASEAHAEENAGALGITLAPTEITKIEGAFPLGRRPRSLPML